MLLCLPPFPPTPFLAFLRWLPCCPTVSTRQVLTEAARCLALKGTPVDLEALQAAAVNQAGGNGAAASPPPAPGAEDFSLKYDVHSSMR